jgi:hypothetical protein
MKSASSLANLSQPADGTACDVDIEVPFRAILSWIGEARQGTVSAIRPRAYGALSQSTFRAIDKFSTIFPPVLRARESC